MQFLAEDPVVVLVGMMEAATTTSKPVTPPVMITVATLAMFTTVAVLAVTIVVAQVVKAVVVVSVVVIAVAAVQAAALAVTAAVVAAVTAVVRVVAAVTVLAVDRARAAVIDGLEFRANAFKLLLITTNLKNQRKNQRFSFDLFFKPKARPAVVTELCRSAGYANA